MRVAFEGALGDAIVGFIPGQLPHDDRLVWGRKMSLIKYHSLTGVIRDLIGLLKIGHICTYTYRAIHIFT